MGKKSIYIKITESIGLVSMEEVDARNSSIDNDDNAGRWVPTQSIVPLIDEHQLVGKRTYNKRTDKM